MRINFLPTNDLQAERYVKIWVLTFFSITLSLQLWRIYSLNATYDQGLFLQEIWNSWHGRPFESTLAAELSAPVMFDGAFPQVGYRHLAQHFTPLLILWSPIVALFGVWALPLIQIGFISLAGWILFILGREHISPRLAAWITCSFFSTGLVIGPSLENFHDLCTVPLLVFTLLLGITKNQKLLYLIPAFLLPLVREDVGIMSFGIGFWMLCRRPSWRLFGIGLCLYSLIAVLVITNWAMPMFGSELSDRFMQERFGQYLEGDEGGTWTVLKAMLSQPFLLFSELISPPGRTFRFLITLFLPLGFFPLLSIDSWLLILMPLLVALSSQGGNALAVSLRFVLYLVPGIFAGNIFWWRNRSKLFYKKSFRSLWRFCLVIAFIFAITGNTHRSFSAVIPDSFQPWVHIPIQEQWRRGRSIDKFIALLPNESSISAETHLIPKLAMRRILLRFPENYKYLEADDTSKEVEFVISQPRFNLSYAPAFGYQERWVEKSLKLLKELTKNNKYGVFYCDSQTIILQRDGGGNANELECFDKQVSYVSKRLHDIRLKRSP